MDLWHDRTYVCSWPCIKPPNVAAEAKLRHIDWIGFFLFTGSLIGNLVPITQVCQMKFNVYSPVELTSRGPDRISVERLSHADSTFASAVPSLSSARRFMA